MELRKIMSPMPGRIMEVLVGLGDHVAVGDVVVVLESMKMENDIRSDCRGLVAAVNVTERQAVSEGDSLVEVETT